MGCGCPRTSEGGWGWAHEKRRSGEQLHYVVEQRQSKPRRMEEGFRYEMEGSLGTG